MGYTLKLLGKIRHRYIANVAVSNLDSSIVDHEVKMLLDTGAFNTMIDFDLAKRFGVMLSIKTPISIGGHLGEAQGCIIPKLTVGGFEMQRVFVLAFPFKDWLVRHIILGANVLNNWDFTTSRTDNVIRFSERIPHDVPNKEYPYQNYFIKGEYVAVQDETLNSPDVTIN